MKSPLLIMAFAALSLSAAELPRNPFWPIGYEGVRRPISAVPRFPTVQKPLPGTQEAKQEAAEKAVKAEAQKKAKESAVDKAKTEAERKAKAAAEKAENELWNAAMKTMSFGGTMGVVGADGKSRDVVTINGRPYSVGDLISLNLDKIRFTWKLKAVNAGGKLQLERIKRKPIDPEPAK